MAQRPRRLRLRRAAWADQRQPLQGTDRARCVRRVGEQREPVLSLLRLLKACGERWRFDWSTAWLLSTPAPSSSHRSPAHGGWRAKLWVGAELLWIQRQVQRRRSEQWLRWREESEEQQAAARRLSPHHGHLQGGRQQVRLRDRTPTLPQRRVAEECPLSGFAPPLECCEGPSRADAGAVCGLVDRAKHFAVQLLEHCRKATAAAPIVGIAIRRVVITGRARHGGETTESQEHWQPLQGWNGR